MSDSDTTINLTFKDLKQQKFTIEAKKANTIAEVKEMIANEKGWDAATQKLIYSGKILQDQNTVESYKIEEKGFIVCMVSKPKTQPGTSTPGSSSAAAPSTPVKSPSTPAQAPAAPAQVPAAPSSASTGATAIPETPTPAAQAATGQTTSSGTFNDPSALAMGNDRETAIQNIVEMGFERSLAERAMRAAYNNPDRAVEYLMTEIPDNQQQSSAPAAVTPSSGQTQPTTTSASGGAAVAATAPTTAQSTNELDDQNINLFEAAAARASGPGRGAGGGLTGATAAGTGGAASGAEGGTGNLDFLRNNPQFQQLRQVIQQQPQMLEPILQQVGSGNPQLAQLINSNPEAFLRLLAEDTEGEDDGMGGTVPPGAHQIQVSEDERDAIERLCQLGFSRDMVIQAYFACDKNEELAANFLFEQPPEDD